MQQPSQEVIGKAMAGSTDAFRIIVENYQGFAYAVSYRFVGNEYDAEDIVQEAFIRLWHNMHKYRSEVKLSTWLYRIVVNLCLDFLKSTQGKVRQRKVDISTSYSMPDTSTPEHILHTIELMKAIQQAAEELTPKQRAVFILRDLEALPVEEVCTILSMSA
jgi:RNA polymerase sigma-70 factor (ECF subfamily)